MLEANAGSQKIWRQATITSTGTAWFGNQPSAGN